MWKLFLCCFLGFFVGEVTAVRKARSSTEVPTPPRAQSPDPETGDRNAQPKETARPTPPHGPTSKKQGCIEKLWKEEKKCITEPCQSLDKAAKWCFFYGSGVLSCWLGGVLEVWLHTQGSKPMANWSTSWHRVFQCVGCAVGCGASRGSYCFMKKKGIWRSIISETESVVYSPLQWIICAAAVSGMHKRCVRGGDTMITSDYKAWWPWAQFYLSSCQHLFHNCGDLGQPLLLVAFLKLDEDAACEMLDVVKCWNGQCRAEQETEVVAGDAAGEEKKQDCCPSPFWKGKCWRRYCVTRDPGYMLGVWAVLFGECFDGDGGCAQNMSNECNRVRPGCEGRDSKVVKRVQVDYEAQPPGVPMDSSWKRPYAVSTTMCILQDITLGVARQVTLGSNWGETCNRCTGNIGDWCNNKNRHLSNQYGLHHSGKWLCGTFNTKTCEGMAQLGTWAFYIFLYAPMMFFDAWFLHTTAETIGGECVGCAMGACLRYILRWLHGERSNYIMANEYSVEKGEGTGVLYEQSINYPIYKLTLSPGSEVFPYPKQKDRLIDETGAQFEVLNKEIKNQDDVWELRSVVYRNVHDWHNLEEQRGKVSKPATEADKKQEEEEQNAQKALLKTQGAPKGTLRFYPFAAGCCYQWVATISVACAFTPTLCNCMHCFGMRNYWTEDVVPLVGSMACCLNWWADTTLHDGGSEHDSAKTAVTTGAAQTKPAEKPAQTKPAEKTAKTKPAEAPAPAQAPDKTTQAPIPTSPPTASPPGKASKL